MAKQQNSCSTSWYPDAPMKDEHSSTHSYPDSSVKRLRTTHPAALPTGSSLVEIALEIEKLTEQNCCLQREIDALMGDCLEDKMMKRKRTIKNIWFGDLVQSTISRPL